MDINIIRTQTQLVEKKSIHFNPHNFLIRNKILLKIQNNQIKIKQNSEISFTKEIIRHFQD